MMNNKQIIEHKLEFLLNKLEYITDFHNENQVSFLLKEIDYWRTELLKIETEEHFKELKDEQNH